MVTQEGAAHAACAKLVNKGFAPRAIHGASGRRCARWWRARSRRCEAARASTCTATSPAHPGGDDRAPDRRARAGRGSLHRFAHHMIAAADPFASDAANAAGAAAIDGLYAYLGALIEARRGRPRDDSLAPLAAEEAAPPHARRAALPVSGAAGRRRARTTTNLIDLGAKALLDAPDELARLERRPGFENAIEGCCASITRASS
jgi:cytochrome P450